MTKAGIIFSLKDSTVEKIRINGLKIDDLNDALSDAKNLNIILILDSCFSENAFDKFSASNYYLLMASSGKTKTSKFPPASEYSAFTGELLNVLQNGIASGKEFLTWRDIYMRVRDNLVAKNFPIPKIIARNEVDDLEVCKNNFTKPIENFDNEWMKLIIDISHFNSKMKKEVDLICKSDSLQTISALQNLFLEHIPFPVGYHLNRLFTKETTVEDFILVYEKIVQFLCFIFLTQLSDAKNKQKINFENNYKSLIINNIDEPDHHFYFQLLPILIQHLRNNSLELFIKDFDIENENWKNSVAILEKVRTETDKTSFSASIKKTILQLLRSVGMLVNYKMVAVKDIRLRYPKLGERKYNHAFALLQGGKATEYDNLASSKDNLSIEFIEKNEPHNSHSILLIRFENETAVDFLNLMPFYLDAHSFEIKKHQDKLIPEILILAGKNSKDEHLFAQLTSEKEIKPFETSLNTANIHFNFKHFDNSLL